MVVCLYFCIFANMEAELLEQKRVHKVMIWLIKVIPMLLAGISMLNTFLSYYGVDWPILSYLGGISLFPLLFLYLASYAFKFCEYHRLFLHYVAVNWILNIIDYYWGIPVSNKGMFLIYMVITGVFFFLLLYLHQREVEKSRQK